MVILELFLGIIALILLIAGVIGAYLWYLESEEDWDEVIDRCDYVQSENETTDNGTQGYGPVRTKTYGVY